MATEVADPGNVGRVTSLSERMQRVVDDGLVPSIRKWGELAGLSHNTLNKFLRAIRAGKVATMRISSIEKMCTVTPTVNPGWLMSGTGAPYLGTDLGQVAARLDKIDANVETLVRRGPLLLSPHAQNVTDEPDQLIAAAGGKSAYTDEDKAIAVRAKPSPKRKRKRP